MLGSIVKNLFIYTETKRLRTRTHFFGLVTSLLSSTTGGVVNSIPFTVLRTDVSGCCEATVYSLVNSF